MRTLRYGPYRIVLDRGRDLSFPIDREGRTLAFSLPGAAFKTFEGSGFVGDVRRGGSCNVETLHLTPHGNGTHTECYGHVSGRRLFITELQTEWMFPGVLASIDIEPGGAVTLNDLPEHAVQQLAQEEVKGLILHVRSLPRLPFDFSDYDAPYIEETLAAWLSGRVDHLLTNLPSLDHRTSTALAAHHAFLGRAPLRKTVTELLDIPADLSDGLYWTVIMTPAIATDAVPSRPVVYPMEVLGDEAV